MGLTTFMLPEFKEGDGFNTLPNMPGFAAVSMQMLGNQQMVRKILFLN